MKILGKTDDGVQVKHKKVVSYFMTQNTFIELQNLKSKSILKLPTKASLNQLVQKIRTCASLKHWCSTFTILSTENKIGSPQRIVNKPMWPLKFCQIRTSLVGVIATELARNLQSYWFLRMTKPIFNFVAKTPFYGAQTPLYCALDDAIECESGMYYSDCARKNPSNEALNKEDQKRLWDISEEMVGIKSSKWSF